MGDVGMSAPVSMDATWAACQKKHRDCVPWTVTAWKGHQNTALLPWWDGLPDPSVCECQCVGPRVAYVPRQRPLSCSPVLTLESPLTG